MFSDLPENIKTSICGGSGGCLFFNSIGSAKVAEDCCSDQRMERAFRKVS